MESNRVNASASTSATLAGARWLRGGGLLVLLGPALAGLYLFRASIPVAEWYGLLSLPTSTLSEPIGGLADRLNIPLLSALIFGLLGALSPCQLSTNVAAFAYTTRRADRPAEVAASASAYLVGKILVYTLIGIAAVALGAQLQQASIPVIVAARKLLGPVLLIMGFAMLGGIRLRVSVGDSASGWLQQRAAGGGVLGAFLLGMAFAFAFCPTLFWLFFGLTLPLAIASPLGFVYPAVFALGTTLPLLAFAILAAGAGATRAQFVRQTKAVSRPVQWIVGVVFILVGLNEIILYWLI